MKPVNLYRKYGRFSMPSPNAIYLFSAYGEGIIRVTARGGSILDEKGECMKTTSMHGDSETQSDNENNKESNTADKTLNSEKRSISSVSTSNKTYRVMFVYRNQKWDFFSSDLNGNTKNGRSHPLMFETKSF